MRWSYLARLVSSGKQCGRVHPAGAVNNVAFPGSMVYPDVNEAVVERLLAPAQAVATVMADGSAHESSSPNSSMKISSGMGQLQELMILGLHQL